MSHYKNGLLLATVVKTWPSDHTVCVYFTLHESTQHNESIFHGSTKLSVTKGKYISQVTVTNQEDILVLAQHYFLLNKDNITHVYVQYCLLLRVLSCCTLPGTGRNCHHTDGPPCPNSAHTAGYHDVYGKVCIGHLWTQCYLCSPT